MVGIGSAPNSFLMTRAAELGRGTSPIFGRSISRGAHAHAVDKPRAPAVTNLTATFSLVARRDPDRAADLYRGSRCVTAACRALRHAEIRA